MKPVGKEARIGNLSGDELCRWCGNAGYVEVASRGFKSSWNTMRTEPNANGTMVRDAGREVEVAPCPFCEAGFREEFPQPAAKNEKPTVPPWGGEGYWRGRDPVELSALFETRHPQPVDAPPDWVHVWSWARKMRSPRDVRPFPQQAPALEPADLEHMMAVEDYERIEHEWMAAGSPRTTAQALIGALE